MSNQKGFTLIEILVVVAIIGILASLLMANFVGVRQRARDAQRKSDLRQVQAALELWRADLGTYPSDPLPNCGLSLQGGTPVATYMQNLPCDPLMKTSYQYDSYSTGYCMRTCLENASDSQTDYKSGRTMSSSCTGLTDCPAGDVYNFSVQNP